ncbi:hypothetical protein BC826DRAFT_969021 [Russula brevipes]|nr:hypothetical protein BC826DRAFT_969021 [Russula brevipes]
MASATSGQGLYAAEGESIIIKRRRKRLPPPEPCLDKSVPLDIVLPDAGYPLDFTSDVDDTREGCPWLGDALMSEGHAGESSPVLTRDCTRSALSIPSQEKRSVTLHEFLRGITGKAGRKYGRRNRLARGNPGAYSRRGPTPTPQPKTPPLFPRVPHPRRKKIFAKSLAQRLFEADVFSSGTSKSSRPTSAQDHAHASSTSTDAGARRPLQFVTSLNLTPSLESRIYPKKKWHRGGEAAGGSDVDTAMRRTVPDPAGARNAPAPDHLAVSGVASWSGAATGRGSDARTAHTRRSVPSGRKTALRARGGRQSAVQMPPSPFQYVALPLVHVNTLRGAVQAPSGAPNRTGADSDLPNRYLNCCPLAPSSLHHGWSDIARRP